MAVVVEETHALIFLFPWTIESVRGHSMLEWRVRTTVVAGDVERLVGSRAIPTVAPRRGILNALQ